MGDETRMYRTHPTLAPEVTLPDVAPVEARALEATLVLSTLILLPVRGERLERSFARLALALRQTVRLLRLPRGGVQRRRLELKGIEGGD